ncbi:terpene synthase family protein [Actinosynnema sp. NPDC050436]|uniref:terpene synthase family protein n=1 Tax=Actinosynnema sp. NPDC050436 TaxID=3155659 RepID=UPI0033E5B74E
MEAGNPPSHPVDRLLSTSRANPLADIVESRSQAWLDRHRLVDGHPSGRRVRDSQMGKAVSRLYPDAGIDLLQLASDFITWLTAFDDLHVEAPEAGTAALAPRIAAFLRVLHSETTSAPGCPFESALAELSARMGDVLDAVAAARVVAALHDTFLGMLWETTVRHRRISLTEYETMRPYTIFGHVAISFIAPCAGLDLPPAAYESAPIRQLNSGFALWFGFANDLRTFRHEQQLGISTVSLPTVIAQERGCSLDDALAEASRRCARELDAVRRLVTELSASSAAHLPPYAAALATAYSGTEQVYRTFTQRYGSEDGS